MTTLITDQMPVFHFRGLVLTLICTATTCFGQSTDQGIASISEYGVTFVPQSEWSQSPRGGFEAVGSRRNLAVGDSVYWRDLMISVAEMVSSHSETDSVALVLERGATTEYRWAQEGTAFEWAESRIAVLAVRTDEKELGGGKTELEIADISSVPDSIARSKTIGGSSHRLRVPHQIKALVLHHSGDPEPLRPGDDPMAKLRKLQEWSETDRNWWDVPYHLLLDLDGRVLEGRDFRYAGDTNTRYDPQGYLIVSVIGNYDLQEPTPAQIEALSRIFAWAASEFDIPEDQIIGHSDVADTACPGEGLRRLLKDGTLFERAREVSASVR